MGLIKLISKGSFKHSKKFFSDMLQKRYARVLERYGQLGVSLLAANTPVDSGLTASSWNYEVVDDDQGVKVVWYNSNVQKGWANVALLLQYGHATGTGGYVTGVDYINPALQPVFDKMAEAAWREVKDS